MRTYLGTALALALAAATPALAGDAKTGPIEVKGAWVRATPPSAKAAGAYLTLTNAGGDGEGDSLVGASTPAAKVAELHIHLQDGDVMRMRAVKNVDIRPGQTLDFAPGGLHVMLIDLKAPLKPGTAIPLTLEFARAGKVTVSVDVQAANATGPAATMHDQHMEDPAHRAMHEEHMKDPAHRAMHEQMHGKP